MPTVAEVLERADALAEQLKALTDKTNAAALAPVKVALLELQRFTVADWVRRFGGVDGVPADYRDAQQFVDATQARINKVFSSAGPTANRALKAQWPTAYDMGVEQGLETAPTAPESSIGAAVVPVLGVLAAIEAQRLVASSRLNIAQLLVEGFPSVTRTMKAADSVVPRVESLNAFQLTRAATTGTTAVADATGALRMWVAERNACVHCAAYAGSTTAVDVFPVGLTFGDKPQIPPGPLFGPALHPHCRCVIELLDPQDTAVSAALKREAKRSVLRGFSLPSESEPVRLRAADRLLSQYPGLPKTVEAYAARAVSRGRFPTRDVPAPA